MNAMKHGLTGELQLLPDEDPEEFRQLCEMMEATWLPVDLREKMLVERITEAQWMLRRIDKREAGLAELEVQFRDLSVDRLLEFIKFVSVEGGREFDRMLKIDQNPELLSFDPPNRDANNEMLLALLDGRLESAVRSEDLRKKILDRILGCEVLPEDAGHDSGPARTFVRNEKYFSLNARYRAHWVKSRARDEAELKRLQHAREAVAKANREQGASGEQNGQLLPNEPKLGPVPES